MAVWTLTHTPDAGGPAVTKTLEEWGAERPVLTRKSQSPDELRLSVSQDADGPTDWVYKDTLTLLRDGVRYFEGQVAATPRRTQGTERVEYLIANLWWRLERLPFQQGWGEWDDAAAGGSGAVVTGLRTRVLLGMDDDGNLITTGAQLDALLAYAVSHGLPLQIGNVLAGRLVWTSEERDQTVAGLIRKVMEHHPDAVTWVDYSTGPPTLHIEEAAALITQPVPMLWLDAGWEVRSRDEHLPSGVHLTYEQVHSINGNKLTKAFRDVYPPGASISDGNAIAVTLPLRGASVTTQAQRLTTLTIPVAGSQGLAVEEWWQDKLPELAQFSTDNLLIGNHTIEFARLVAPPDPVIPGGAVVDSEDPGDYPRELIEGGIEDWMGYKAARLIVSAVVAYTDELNAAASAFFTDQIDVDGTTYPARVIYHELEGTDATTGLKRTSTVTEVAEAVPSGIAQAYYEALLELGWEGRFSLTDDEVDGALRPGKKVAIIDSALADLATMDAVIQATQEDLTRGVTAVTFGPPEHLSVQDFFEAQRLGRRRAVARISPRERTDAEETEESLSIGPHQTPRSNSTSPSLGVKHGKEGFNVTMLGDGKVQITSGLLIENGDTVHVIDPPDGISKTVSGIENLWVTLDTDKDGASTAVGAVWGSKPTGLQAHRPAKGDGPEDVGQTGKYAWKVLEVSNTSGKIEWTHYATLIQFYPDRYYKTGNPPALPGEGTDIYEDPPGSGAQEYSYWAFCGSRPLGGSGDMTHEAVDTADIPPEAIRPDIPSAEGISAGSGDPVYSKMVTGSGGRSWEDDWMGAIDEPTGTAAGSFSLSRDGSGNWSLTPN